MFGGTAAVATAAVAGPAVAERAPEPRFDPVVVEEALARIDRRMALLSEIDLSGGVQRSPAGAELFATRSEVGRAALRTLYLTGAFMELEEHERLHPGVQARMARMQGEMDVAVQGMASYLEALTPADHRRLQRALQDDPDLGMRIGERLQEVAKEDGMGFARRVDLRLATADFTQRMKSQNPALLLESLVQRTRKVEAGIGTLAEQERAVQVRAGEEAFWAFQERSARYVAGWDQVYATRPRSDLKALESTYPEGSSSGGGSSVSVKRVGAYIMGAGLGTAAIGGIIYLIGMATATGGVVAAGVETTAIVLGVTVGPALLLAGLIVFLVGAIAFSEQPF